MIRFSQMQGYNEIVYIGGAEIWLYTLNYLYVVPIGGTVVMV